MSHGTSDPIDRMSKQEKLFFLPYLPTKVAKAIPKEKPNKTTDTFNDRNVMHSVVEGSKSHHQNFLT
jgi:hypothetical protein